MKRQSIFIVFSLISLFGFSQTFITGGIYSTTTWSASGNPYILSDTVVVFQDVDLTIEPGVAMKFNKDAILEIRGTLTAIGTVNDSIVFTSNLEVPSKGAWTGIIVQPNTNGLEIGDQITMHYVKGEYADVFINLDLGISGPYEFRNCYFANNFQVNKDGGWPVTTFDSCTFVSNELALDYCQFDSKVTNSVFLNNVDGLNGINLVKNCFFSGNTGVAVDPYGMTVGCTIIDNNIGVVALFNSSNNVFKNNILKNNNVGIIIESYFNGTIDFTGNTICNNSLYNVKLDYYRNADLSNNCWCEQDSANIRDKIYDGYTDVSVGLVSFMPVADSCPLISDIINQDIIHPTIKLFPNPFSRFIIVELKNNEPFDLTLFSFNGQPVLKKQLNSSNRIDTEHLTPAPYFYRITFSDNSTKTGILIKK